MKTLLQTAKESRNKAETLRDALIECNERSVLAEVNNFIEIVSLIIFKEEYKEKNHGK